MENSLAFEDSSERFIDSEDISQDEIDDLLKTYYIQLGICTHSIKRLERDLRVFNARCKELLAGIDNCLETMKTTK